MTSPTPPGLVATVGLYTLARLALVGAIAAVLGLFGVPLVIALLVALIVALPLSMVLFRGLRTRLDAAIAEVTRRRAVEREALRSRLRGDDGRSGEGPDRGADAGEQRPREQQ